MGSLTYLFVALAVTWLGIFGYLYYLGQRVRELRRDLESVEQQAHSGSSSPQAQSH